MAGLRPKKSTIVRAQLHLTRRAFRVLERVAPGQGSRLALRLWCTPRHARPADARAAPGTRRELGLHGGTIVTESWGDGPPVYLVHGWGGYRGQLTGLVGPLVSAGYRVVAFDALGHGESGTGPLGPGRANLPEFADALTAAVAEFGPAHGIVAHSLGSAATMLAVLDGLSATRLVFLAPVAEPIAHTYEFAKALGFGERIHTRLLRRLEQMTRRAMSDFDFPARLDGRVKLPPLLVLHDTRDREVGHHNGKVIADRWPGAKLITTEGLGHRRILADPEVLREVTDFVTVRENAVSC